MGHPPGQSVEDVQERVRTEHRVKDSATCIIADAIEVFLRQHDAAALQRMYGLDVREIGAVLKEVKAIRKRIDPYGDWNS